MIKKMISKKEKIIRTLLSGKASKKYQGKEVIVFNNHIYVMPDNGVEAAQLIKRLQKQNPRETPTVTFVPRKGTYILILI